jgi:Type III secretion system lipoprotein chaperone (YscW)
LITGRVVIAGSIPRFIEGVLRVRLEDVSYADKAAGVVGETVIRGVTHPPGDAAPGSDTVVPFSLDAVVGIVGDHDYSVRVSLELEDAGHRTRSTIGSDQVYRVLTRGFGTDVTVALGR